MIEFNTAIQVTILVATGVGGLIGGYKARGYWNNGRSTNERPKLMSEETKRALEKVRYVDTCDARWESITTQLKDIKDDIKEILKRV
jgi:hypothetical protein